MFTVYRRHRVEEDQRSSRIQADEITSHITHKISQCHDDAERTEMLNISRSLDHPFTVLVAIPVLNTSQTPMVLTQFHPMQQQQNWGLHAMQP
jgi:hypothetical protein